MYGYDHGIIIYPLVNVYKKLWKDPPFFMGQFTISMVIFHSCVTNYQRVTAICLQASF